MSLLLLKTEMEEIEEREAALKKEKAECQSRIDAAIAEAIRQARAIQGKELGAVTALVDGVTVKHTVGKKIEWDQYELSLLWNRIKEAGDFPAEYIDRKLSVSESIYKKSIPEIRAHFDRARTVKPGSVKVELVVKE